MPGLPLARKAGGYYASGQPPTSLAIVRSGPGWKEAVSSTPAVLNQEASCRLGAYYTGFPFPCGTEGTGERPLVSLCQAQTTREPMCSKSRKLFPFLEFCLVPTFQVIFKCLALWICILEGRRGDSTQSRAGWVGGWGGLRLCCCDNDTSGWRAVTPTADINHILPRLLQQL